MTASSPGRTSPSASAAAAPDPHRRQHLLRRGGDRQRHPRCALHHHPRRRPAARHGLRPHPLLGAAELAITGTGSYATNRRADLADNANTLTVAGTLTLTGAITGGGSSGSLTKAGAGTFNQTAAGSWNGNVFITQGTYNLASTGGIDNAGVIQLTGEVKPSTSTAPPRCAPRPSRSTPAPSTSTPAPCAQRHQHGLGNGLQLERGHADHADGWFRQLGVTDRRAPGSSLSAQPVFEGRIIDVTGTAAAITVPNGGVLDLGPTYGSYGMRYDQLKIAGSLNLSSAGNTLNFEFNPFFFRPSVYGTDGAGTLILVDADSFTGTFENFTGVQTDFIGFTAAPAADRWWACWAPRRSTR
ncbi:MAG: hypothetical protein U1F87_10810 [Kiritimatiellia bacterium]